MRQPSLELMGAFAAGASRRGGDVQVLGRISNDELSKGRDLVV